jgi:hypothetical protein
MAHRREIAQLGKIIEVMRLRRKKRAIGTYPMARHFTSARLE